jgi:dTDP-4-dehydrorhamnose reductase
MAADPILLLGANGQVGYELARALPRIGRVVALERQAADLGAPERLREVVLGYRPRIIVNAAAYTAVDRAETDAAMAGTVNAVAPGVLAEVAEALGAVLVHYSTDYVFDGEKPLPYTETDAPNPRSIYGRTKLEGERAVARAGRHLILRTSWVFGAHGANFLKTMLRLAAERESLRVVADQVGAPTSAALIAATTSSVLEALQGAPAGDPRFGLYHLAAGGETSWHGYARYVLARAAAGGWPLKAGPEAVAAITTADYPLPTRRPANSRLDTAKLRRAFSVDLPDWRAGVDAVLAELLAERNRTATST